MPDDYEKIATLAAQKVVRELHTNRQPNRDDEFIQKLVTAMVEHRSPCHELSPEEVHSLKTFVESRIKYAKAKGLVKIALAIFVIKELYIFILANLHWGK